MRKVPTLFKRDPENMSRVLNEVNPAAAWVLDGEGRPTRKFDGTCLMHESYDGPWFARREVKPGKQPPPNFRAEETDPNTGKTVGWEPIEQSAFFKAFCTIAAPPREPGTYELCGPKINGNPEGFDHHVLVPHGVWHLINVPTPPTFDDLREWMSTCLFEGIVWHHPDGRMAKLKRRDFGASS